MIAFSPSDVAVYYAARVPALRQRGKRWRGPCPIHGGKHDNFSVDSENGLWRCWSSCGRGGDMIALETILTGAAWRDAVAEIESIIGRTLLNRPASRAERRASAQRREQERFEMQAAKFFRLAAVSIAEHILDELPEAVPERYAPTQLLLELRPAEGAALLAMYRDFRQREPRLTAALVHAGRERERRLQRMLASYIAAEVNHAAA